MVRLPKGQADLFEKCIDALFEKEQSCSITK